MKVLLTGASGFLGRHLANALMSANYQVVMITHETPISCLTTLSEQYEGSYPRNLLDTVLIWREHPDLRAIIHCATAYDQRATFDNVLDANLHLPLLLMDFAASKKIAFIHTDSFLTKFPSHYPYLPQYILTKRQCVSWGNYFSHMRNLQFINLRLEHVYGDGDSSYKFIPNLIQQCFEGKPLYLTPALNQRDFVFISDVVSAYLSVLANLSNLSGSTLIEVGTGVATTIAEVVQRIHQLTNSRSEIHFAYYPYRTGEVMRSAADLTKLTQLDWESTINLAVGLQQLIASFKREE